MEEKVGIIKFLNMKKYLVALVSSFMAAASLSDASAEITEFTYAEGELFSYGQGKKENIDVAICIDNPSLEGMRLIGFRAYLSCADGFENTSLWLSNELNLEDKVNAPDIASYDVTPVSVPYGEGNIGLLSIDLPQPYILNGEPLYLGYSITVAQNETMEQKYPMVLSEGSHSNGFYLHMSKSVLKWMDYTKKAGGVAYIVALLDGDFYENSLSIKSSEEAYAELGKNFEMQINVNNNGGATVENLKYIYTYDNEDKIYEGSVSLPSPIQPDLTLYWPVTLTFEGISQIGPHDVNLTITEINGVENMSSQSSVSGLVNVMPYIPQHRPLVEEFTGLWCGWCPRGWIGMDMLGEKFGPDEVTICYHNGDAMAVTSTYPVDFDGYPSASIDRIDVIDPYYGTFDESVDFGISYDVENAMNQVTMADVQISAELVGTTVNAETSVIFMKDIKEADYELGYVLVCNGLTSPSWVQQNYYAGLGSEYVGTYLEEVCELPKRAAGLIFNDVAVDVSGMNGVPGSIPESIKTGETYTHAYSFDIKDNSLVQNQDNLIVTVFVIDKKTKRILNANKCDCSGLITSIDSLDDDNIIVSSQYYDLNGRKITNPSGLVIRADKLKDGSLRTRKVVIK